MKKIITLIFAVFFLFSCATKEEVVYFNGMNSSDNSIGLESYFPTYHIADEVIIIVNALDPEAVIPFNKVSVTVAQNTGDAQGRATLQTYRIDSDGNINFPVIGKIKIAGLNREQAINYLQEKLGTYIVDPIVDIETVNYRITVLGEVNQPGTYSAVNERITLIEALSLAGDLTIYGERENVLVIQDYDGKKTYTRVNLKSNELFESPVYYLSQNDIVYVEPNKTQAKASSIGPSTGVIFSVLGIMISTTALIITIINVNNRP